MSLEPHKQDAHLIPKYQEASTIIGRALDGIKTCHHQQRAPASMRDLLLGMP